MSYELFYDKQFVKVHDKYMPMTLGGSSNCYEVSSTRNGCGRRERNWWNDTYITNGKPMATKEEILARCEEIRQNLIERYPVKAEPEDRWYEPYNDKRFGYFSAMAIRSNTSKMTFGMFKGWYVTGMKKALTIEQLADEDVKVAVYVWDYDGKKQKKVESLGLPWYDTTIVTTSDELIEVLQKYEDTYHNLGFDINVKFIEYNLEYKMKRIREKYFGGKSRQRKEYKFVDVDKYYTITFNWNGDTEYFVKQTRRYIRHSGYPYHTFATEKEAQRFVNRRKGGSITLTVKEMNERGRIKVTL